MRKDELELKRICKKLSAIDDRLGMYSDYEGDENGPTYHLFKTYSLPEFDKHTNNAVALHNQAANLWTRLLTLKEKVENAKG